MGLSKSGSNSRSLETLSLRKIAETEELLLVALNAILAEVAPSPEELQFHSIAIEYIANLCSTLYVDNDFSQKAWAPCVRPYLAAFLPPEEASHAAELFRSRSEKAAEVSFFSLCCFQVI